VSLQLLLHSKFGLPDHLVVSLPLGCPRLIPLNRVGSERMWLTLIDAGSHCPGAVMLLLEGYFGRVLYTGDVRFDRAMLPGRTATPTNGDWPTAAAADLLRLHGWPRAVPFDIAHWTVVLNGNAGVLVAFLPGTGFGYLPIHRAAAGWSVGPPCSPR